MENDDALGGQPLAGEDQGHVGAGDGDLGVVVAAESKVAAKVPVRVTPGTLTRATVPETVPVTDGPEGQVGRAVGEPDQGPRAVAELHPDVGGRQVHDAAGLLDGHVAAEDLAGDGEDDAGARNPQVGAGGQVEGDGAAAQGDRALDGGGRGVHGQRERAGQRQRGCRWRR